jgi:hypothetical protein
MRYGGIWIKRGHLLVRSHERNQADDDFAADFERLYKQGHLVSLIPGKSHGLDELLMFETAEDALNFYNSDLRDFECFIGDDHEPCGFEEVSLYVDGRRVATKSCAPTKWIEVNHE